MNLLAVDSAASILSIAVSRGNEIFYEEADAAMKQSEIVMDIIDSQMKKAGLKPDELNGIVCMGGPGSFTGLRIGYSIAKGLALSLSIPIMPVPTLECISFMNDELLLAVIEARKNAWFYAFFKNKERITEDHDGGYMQIADEISRYQEKIILTGYGADILFNLLPHNIMDEIILKFERKGYAKELIYIAKERNLLDNDNTAYLYSGPEYVRKTDAELRNQ